MMRNRIRNTGLSAALLLFILVLTGCEQKTVNDIKADPSRYADREVVLIGTVLRSFSIMGNGLYELEDSTGKILVVSKTGVPRKGAHVAVKGTVKDAYDLSLFRLPEEVSSGLVLIEISHKAR